MKQNWVSPLEKIERMKNSMTPKAKILGDYILGHSRKAVFMTTSELASVCGASEATVVRFVAQLGYNGYGEFLHDLRATVDAELTILDRSTILSANDNGSQAFKRWIQEKTDSLRFLFESISHDDLEKAIDMVRDCKNLFVIGSRLTYSLAHYMQWVLMKATPNVQVLNGSDTTCIDRLYIAPPDTLSVIITVSRYPTELIRLGKVIKGLNHNLLLITDSKRCPIISFASQSLFIPCLQIPSAYKDIELFMSVINFIVMEVISSEEQSPSYQEILEKAYQENDLLFTMHHLSDKDNI